MKSLKKGISLALMTTLVGGLVACAPKANVPSTVMTNPNQVGALSTKRPKSIGKWTIAIHMAADNNLYTAGLDDINEMEAALSEEAAKNVNIIVLFDGMKQGDSKVYKITPDKSYDKKIISEVLKTDLVPASNEIDSGSADTFTKFVNYVTKTFPGDRNLISIWNHGGGIFKKSQNGKVSAFSVEGPFGANKFGTKSFASDDESGHHMTTPALTQALTVGRQNLGRNVDIFAFDTCLMGTIETAYQMYGLVDNMIASEETEPGDGWDYIPFIKALGQNPSMAPKAVATTIVDSYIASYSTGGSQGASPGVTQAASDINVLATELVPALNDLAKALTASLPANKAFIKGLRDKAQTYYLAEPADLGHFLKMVVAESTDANIKAKANTALEKYNKTIIKSGFFGPQVKDTTGLVVYFPEASYNKRYDDVSEFRFAETKEWGTFLKTYLGK